MKIRKMKSNLDERQELKLLKIEHNGCWIAFWGLLIVMAIQMIVGNDSIKNLAGEGAVLMSLAFYLLVACIRNGIWDRRLKPNFKTNVIVSSIAAVLTGIIWFSVSYRNYHKLIGSIATGIIVFVQVEILCLLALMISSKIYKRRVQKLEEDENPSN